MNPLKGEAPLKLADGRELTLAMDFEALVAAETAYGKPIAHVMLDAQRGFLGASRAFLFGALRTHHPEMTPAEASALILSDGEAVLAALEVATELAFPKAAEGKQGANPPRGGTGSGGSGAKRASTRPRSGKRPHAPTG